jgi:hypothetical protein
MLQVYMDLPTSKDMWDTLEAKFRVAEHNEAVLWLREACCRCTWTCLQARIEQAHEIQMLMPGWMQSSSWRSDIWDHLLLTSARTQFRTQWHPVFYALWVLTITRIGWWIGECNKLVHHARPRAPAVSWKCYHRSERVYIFHDKYPAL